jgi:hypothetical protein
MDMEGSATLNKATGPEEMLRDADASGTVRNELAGPGGKADGNCCRNEGSRDDMPVSTMRRRTNRVVADGR